jgi:uncharacterized protein
MKRALFDANFLIALFDTQHNFHQTALDWFEHNRESGWATCPLTETALIRILSNSGYSKLKKYGIPDLIAVLQENTASTDHDFWPSDISFLDRSLFFPKNILGPKQLTDIYLLALAVKNEGRLVTFDARISTNSVKDATKEHIVTL